MKNALFFVAAMIPLAACEPAVGTDQGAQTNAVSVLNHGEIETAPDGRCFARTNAPTQTIIVEEQVLVVPEVRDANGTMTSPPVFRNITRPQTVDVGVGERFETLCAPQYTQTMIATLQRALRVRGTYTGPISGTLDAATSQAVLDFQRSIGRDSAVLDMSTARQLGIVTTPIDKL